MDIGQKLIFQVLKYLKLFEKSVLGVYSLLFGVERKVDIQFYFNFNKEQKPQSLTELIYIQIVNFWVLLSLITTSI